MSISVRAPSNSKASTVCMPRAYLEAKAKTLAEHLTGRKYEKAVLIRDDYRFLCREHRQPGLAAAILLLYVKQLDRQGEGQNFDLAIALCGAWVDREVAQAREWLRTSHLLEAEYTPAGTRYWPNFFMIEAGQREFMKSWLPGKSER